MIEVSGVTGQRSDVVLSLDEWLHADGTLSEAFLSKELLVKNNRWHGFDKIMLHEHLLPSDISLLEHIYHEERYE